MFKHPTNVQIVVLIKQWRTVGQRIWGGGTEWESECVS